MIYQQVIARRYAKGLRLAGQEADLIAIEQDLKFIAEILESDQNDFARLFKDPSFSPLDRRKVIDQIAEKSSMNNVLHSFLRLVAGKGRMNILPLIYQAFVAMNDEANKRVRATIKSATPLSAEQIKEITDALAQASQKTIFAKDMIDKSLLGGVRVEVAGAVFDGSLKAKLSEIKERLLQA